MAQLKATKQYILAGLPPPRGSFLSAFDTAPVGSTAVHEGAVLGVGAQYAVSPSVSIGVDYLYGIYGPQEHGGFVGFTAVNNLGIATSFSGAMVVQSPQNLTIHTARFVLNVKLD
jgi:opacity protein-like surface antigen